MPYALCAMRERRAKRTGHYKDYSRGRGLFGKHGGMWWWRNKEFLDPADDRQLQLALEKKKGETQYA